MSEEKNKDSKNIEVITGDGENLDISPVYNHIKINKPTNNTNKDKKIVIPKTKKNN